LKTRIIRVSSFEFLAVRSLLEAMVAV